MHPIPLYYHAFCDDSQPSSAKMTLCPKSIAIAISLYNSQTVHTNLMLWPFWYCDFPCRDPTSHWYHFPPFSIYQLSKFYFRDYPRFCKHLDAHIPQLETRFYNFPHILPLHWCINSASTIDQRKRRRQTHRTISVWWNSWREATTNAILASCIVSMNDTLPCFQNPHVLIVNGKCPASCSELDSRQDMEDVRGITTADIIPIYQVYRLLIGNLIIRQDEYELPNAKNSLPKCTNTRSLSLLLHTHHQVPGVTFIELCVFCYRELTVFIPLLLSQ